MSKVVDDRGPVEAYRALQASLQRLPGTTISLTDVKLIGTANALAQQMLKLQDKKVGWYETVRSNGRITEGYYIYPAPSSPNETRAFATHEVASRVFELMASRGPGPVPPSVITLRDGSSFQGIPVGIEFGSPGSLSLKFIDVASHQIRVLSAEQVASVLELATA